MIAFGRFALRVCAWAVVATAAAPAGDAGERPLSTAEKKQAVYEMYREYKRNDFPAAADMSPQRALAQSDSILFVDGRTDAEMDVSVLPGAIPREEFLENIDRYRDTTVVAYCTISYRTGEFVEDMAGRGLAIYNLEGGILAWVLEGGKVYDNGEVARKIHVYGPRWNFAPSDYEVVTFNAFERLLHWLF